MRKIPKFWWQDIKLFLLVILVVVSIASCYGGKWQPNQPQTLNLGRSHCRTVQHQLGTSCIPMHPQRAIAMDQESLEILVALGLQPIASTRANLVGSKFTLLQDKINQIVDLGKEGQPNLEKIVQLKPDLIIGMFIDPQNYKLFSAIAPTVSIEYSHAAWKKTLQQFAEILNKREEAEKLLADYDQKIQELKLILESKFRDANVSIMRFYTTLQFTQFMNHLSFPGSVIEELKVLSIPVIQRQLVGFDNTYVDVSLERVDLLEADVMFVALDPGADKNFQIYQNSPLWQTLDVVKNQQVYLVDSSYWVFGNIISANAILDDLFKYLAKEKIP